MVLGVFLLASRSVLGFIVVRSEEFGWNGFLKNVT